MLDFAPLSEVELTRVTGGDSSPTPFTAPGNPYSYPSEHDRVERGVTMSLPETRDRTMPPESLESNLQYRADGMINTEGYPRRGFSNRIDI
jgi:hypothetical protein